MTERRDDREHPKFQFKGTLRKSQYQLLQKTLLCKYQQNVMSENKIGVQIHCKVNKSALITPKKSTEIELATSKIENIRQNICKKV